MKKNIVTGVVSLLLCAFFIVATSASAQPPGLEKQGKTPPGFSEGKKAGWEGNYPPGWEQKSSQERERWSERVREGRERVSRSARDQGFSNDEAESAADDYERAVRGGIDPDEGESIVEEELGRGKRGRGLSDAVDEKAAGKLPEKSRSEQVRPERGNDAGVQPSGRKTDGGTPGGRGAGKGGAR
ncbi:MAG TPA: hypothetical protein ENN35_01175 [Deltaproteobacteria bacterium]|nr:hypothetical protein [Deltaproteobacteria bacterium]